MTPIRKSSVALCSVIAACLLWSRPAEALVISDVQSIWATLSADSPTYSSAAEGTSFDLTDNGVPTSATVLWANVSFTLLNSDGQQELVVAELPGDFLWGASAIGFSAFGGLVNGSVLSSLNTSGTLDYTLNYVWGSSSVLVAQAALVAGVTSVPEPASAALFGLGLTGVAALRRRRAAHVPRRFEAELRYVVPGHNGVEVFKTVPRRASRDARLRSSPWDTRSLSRPYGQGPGAQQNGPRCGPGQVRADVGQGLHSGGRLERSYRNRRLPALSTAAIISGWFDRRSQRMQLQPVTPASPS